MPVLAPAPQLVLHAASNWYMCIKGPIPATVKISQYRFHARKPIITFASGKIIPPCEGVKARVQAISKPSK